MSAELEKSINEIVDKRVTALYDEGFKGLTVILNDLESRIKKIEENQIESLENFVAINEEIKRLRVKTDIIDEEELTQLVAKTLITLMPEFKVKISNEIKQHIMAIAKFVIDNFKEKE